MKLKIRGRLENQQGSIITIVAIAMIAFIAVLALVFDLGHMHSVRQELRNAAEAGALAGARALFPLRPLNPPPTDLPYCTLALQRARETAAANKTDIDKDVTVIAADAQLIHWDWKENKRSDFIPSCNLEAATGVNGIRVTARRSGAVPAGSVSLTFGKIFGMDTMDVEVSATAAVGFASKVPTAPFCIPYGLDPTLPLKMNPDKGDNSGWAAAAPYNPTASNVTDWLLHGTAPLVEGPPDGIVNLNNGFSNNYKTFADILAANFDSSLGGWLVVVPVVNVTKFNGSAHVVGFQPIIITKVDAPPSHAGNFGLWIKLYTGPVPEGGTNPGGAASPIYTLPKLVE
jgi:hypothetical protein